MSNSLRIVNIITQMEAGGAQGAAMRMAVELRQRGHIAETWFLYLKRPTYMGYEGVRVLLEYQPRKLTDYAHIFTKLIRELQRFKPSGVITYTHYANVFGQIAASIVGIPARVASQRNISCRYPKAARYLDWIIGCLGFYTTNICVSYSVKDAFKNYPKAYIQRLRVIYNGVSPKESSLNQIEARKKFCLPKQVPLVVSVGRLAPQKNQKILLKALCLLPSVHLAIAGDGQLKEELMKQAEALEIKDRVHFMGEIPPQDIPDFLCSGDVFAFPSGYEAFGFAVLEAVWVGLPIVASDIPALREVLKGRDGEPVGVLIPPDNAEAWAKGMRRLLEDEELRKILVLQAREQAKLFSLEKMVDGYEQCLAME